MLRRSPGLDLLEEPARETITITPPTRGTTGAPNPQWVDLTMKVELCHGEENDVLSDGDRVQYPIQSVVHAIGDSLHGMTENHEVQHWPEVILVLAATALLTANTALKQWLRQDYAECLVTCEVAKREVEACLQQLGC